MNKISTTRITANGNYTQGAVNFTYEAAIGYNKHKNKWVFYICFKPTHESYRANVDTLKDALDLLNKWIPNED